MPRRIINSASPIVFAASFELIQAGTRAAHLLQGDQVVVAGPELITNYGFGGDGSPRRIETNYYFGAGPTGPVSVASSRVHLKHCEAYRVWRNQTGGARDRTVSVYPSAGEFPVQSTVTIFVAPDGHTGGPPAGAGKSVGPGGDSVAVNVPNGSAAFVHYDHGSATATSVDANVGEEP